VASDSSLAATCALTIGLRYRARKQQADSSGRDGLLGAAIHDTCATLSPAAYGRADNFEGSKYMSKPERPSDTPYAVDVEAGKSYWWCSCGKSSKQPFCDGSHKGTEFTPLKYEATSSRKVFFCGCKATAKQPLCDGSHTQ